MTRLEQFKETINLLDRAIAKNQPKYCAAENFKHVFEYCIDVETDKTNNLDLLKDLCNGFPAKEVEGYDERITQSIYQSFSEMKKMLVEKQ
jgi:hypothetical protein